VEHNSELHFPLCVQGDSRFCQEIKGCCCETIFYIENTCILIHQHLLKNFLYPTSLNFFFFLDHAFVSRNYPTSNMICFYQSSTTCLSQNAFLSASPALLLYVQVDILPVLQSVTETPSQLHFLLSTKKIGLLVISLFLHRIYLFFYISIRKCITLDIQL
jgi:hypothetical protein